MIELPKGVDIDHLIDDLRILSWKAADILLFYSQIIKDSPKKERFIKIKGSGDPVTIADLKVNDLIIKKLKEKYQKIQWNILSEENVLDNSKYFHSSCSWLWVLDPLDGTKDFIQGTENYAMHLALNHNNKPRLGIVLIPEKNELWIANGEKVWCEKRELNKKDFCISKRNVLNEMILVTSKNHRNKNLEELIYKINFKNVNVMGSVGCKIASILRGDSDIYISISLPGQPSPKDWDFAAPEAILRNAGGAITNLNNEDLIYNKTSFEQGGIIIASNNKQNHESICLQIKEIIKNYDLYPLDS